MGPEATLLEYIVAQQKVEAIVGTHCSAILASDRITAKII
jgi:hypothetical protein